MKGTYKKKEIKENNQILDDFSSSLHVKIYSPKLKLSSRKFKINISNLTIYIYKRYANYVVFKYVDAQYSHTQTRSFFLSLRDKAIQ